MQHKIDDAKIGPGVELCDPVRLALLRRLKGILGADQKVSRGVQATLLLCDLQYIEEMCKSLDSASSVGKGLIQRGLSISKQEDEIVAKWCQKPRPSSTTPSGRSLSLRRSRPEPSPLRQALPSTVGELKETETSLQPPKRKRSTSLSASSGSSGNSRSKIISMKCKERDDYKCIVTKSAGPIDAAHIFPVSLNKGDERASFFGLLKEFWAQRIEKWESRLNNGTEFIENEMSFSPSIHRYHSAGLFGLQPIEASSDGKSLKLGFYWLDKRQTESSAEMVDLMNIPALAHDFRPKDIAICSSRDEHIIRSGEVIELTTEDPEELPLPDWDLLELQWVLQRLTALKGAAYVPDKVLDDSDDSDYEGSAYLMYDGMEQDDDSHKRRSECDEGWQRARIDDWVGQIQPQTWV
ncbi:hypothetical protein MGYG_06824 [Nannizzia gypsea CBS 118893]|uniref:HNH nuclease domain-containing protein n=1 Tax=Arthroderma gypseum (strain ATCC MYA-4604 / CBS 118893) TaxID=535722 RepID=E4V1B0_ARTGP|nr:hypothetical protein MGYG_06824 [Nannizzia gypsea CBS 118893]EFR03825.1 hypothetical protein MGYG_06824 [Nannizzia gypsea CBS 118893]